jgi:hypothetical protein
MGGRIDDPVTSAVVYDDTGSWEAISAAEALLDRGAKVTLATRFHTFGTAMPDPPSTVDAARERLLAHQDFTLVADVIIDVITPSTVTLGVLGTSRYLTSEADCVVFVGYNESSRDLVDLLPEVFTGEIHLVGDANGGRTLRQAITEGSRVARTI